MKKSSLFNSARFLTLLFVVVCILMSAQGPPPGHEWKEVSQRGKDIVGNPEPDPQKVATSGGIVIPTFMTRRVTILVTRRVVTLQI